MKKKQIVITASFASLFLLGAGSLYLNAYKNSGTEQVISPQNISMKENTIVDWQTGKLQDFEIIYRSNTKDFSISSNQEELIKYDDRKKHINSTNYVVLYTIKENSNVIHASINSKNKKINVSGTEPSEKIRIQYDEDILSETQTDWAGRTELSYKNINLNTAEKICLSFLDSGIGFCHAPVNNQTINKEEVTG
ncbi:MAG: hypothetical protein AAGB32_03820 [Pseudomonadota bacterium]